MPPAACRLRHTQKPDFKLILQQNCKQQQQPNVCAICTLQCCTHHTPVVKYSRALKEKMKREIKSNFEKKSIFGARKEKWRRRNCHLFVNWLDLLLLFIYSDCFAIDLNGFADSNGSGPDKRNQRFEAKAK